MSNQIEKEVGIVIEKLPNAEFKVERQDGSIIRCYLAGKLKLNKIKIDVHRLTLNLCKIHYTCGRGIEKKKQYEKHQIKLKGCNVG